MANYSNMMHHKNNYYPHSQQSPGLDYNNESKISAIEWEDEKTYCFQVEIRGFTIARRKDTNMINGTKLLNFVGMTRGKRDGILKNEPGRVVIKSGSMILKGVWLPLPRAIELAKEHRIFDALYPLFEENIQSFFYSPLYSRGSWDNQFHSMSPFQNSYQQPPQMNYHSSSLGFNNYHPPSSVGLTISPPCYYEHERTTDNFQPLSTNSSFESYTTSYPRSATFAPAELSRQNSDSEINTSYPISPYPPAPLGYSYYSN